MHGTIAPITWQAKADKAKAYTTSYLRYKTYTDKQHVDSNTQDEVINDRIVLARLLRHT